MNIVYIQSPLPTSTAFFIFTETSIYSTEVMLLLIALRLILGARRKRLRGKQNEEAVSVSMASHTSVNEYGKLFVY